MKAKYVDQELHQDFTVTAGGIKTTVLVFPDLEPGDAIVLRQVHVALTGNVGVHKEQS